MNGYENAPATRLLATSCACCGRPLLDAISVEAGVGPDCREKYGYAEAQGAPDWARAALLLGSAHADALAGVWGHDAHGAANVLVHAVGSGTGSLPVRSAAIAAIAALGFAKLGKRLIERAHGIVVEEADGLLRIHASYSPEFNDAVKRVPGSRWIKAEKIRTVPAASRAALWAALKVSFPAGTPVSGARGVTLL
jgi:hypothetical protein